VSRKRSTAHDRAEAPIVMQVPREEVERCNIEPPLQALRAMASTPETTREYGGRVVFVF
jgi:hypothetical protein